MATSLFCEHKRLRSVCPLCGAARAGAATPMRAAIAHDVDDTIHAFRLECHARMRDFLMRVHRGEPSAKAYASSYSLPQHRGKVHSEEEDVTQFRGAFYRGMVKMFDVTIEDRRIQGYNGLADWDEMRDYVFRKMSPEALTAALNDGRMSIHGGNGAWPRQQIASELLRSDAIHDAAMLLAFGDSGVEPAEAKDADIVSRLERADALAVRAGGKPNATALFSKVLHVFAPARWPALTPRATPDVGEELGFPIPAVAKPADYLPFAESMREIMRAKKHPDLVRTGMVVEDAAASIEG